MEALRYRPLQRCHTPACGGSAACAAHRAPDGPGRKRRRMHLRPLSRPPRGGDRGDGPSCKDFDHDSAPWQRGPRAPPSGAVSQLQAQTAVELRADQSNSIVTRGLQPDPARTPQPPTTELRPQVARTIPLSHRTGSNEPPPLRGVQGWTGLRTRPVAHIAEVVSPGPAQPPAHAGAAAPTPRPATPMVPATGAAALGDAGTALYAAPWGFPHTPARLPVNVVISPRVPCSRRPGNPRGTGRSRRRACDMPLGRKRWRGVSRRIVSDTAQQRCARTWPPCASL